MNNYVSLHTDCTEACQEIIDSIPDDEHFDHTECKNCIKKKAKAYKKENPFLSSGEIEEFERRYQEMRDMNEGAAYLMGVNYEKVIEKLGN